MIALVLPRRNGGPGLTQRRSRGAPASLARGRENGPAGVTPGDEPCRSGLGRRATTSPAGHPHPETAGSPSQGPSTASTLDALPPALASARADVHRLVPAGLDPLILDHPCGLTDTAGDLYPQFLDDLARWEADFAPLDVACRAVALGDVWACAWPVPWCAVVRDFPDVRWPDPLDAGVAANPVRVPPADRSAARVARVARGGRCRSGVEGPDGDAADRDGQPAFRCCRNRSSASRSRSTSATLVGTSVRAWAIDSPSFGASGSNAPPSGPAGPVQLRPFTMRSPFLGDSRPLLTSLPAPGV